MSGLLELLVFAGLLLGGATWTLLHLGWLGRRVFGERSPLATRRCAPARLLLYAPLWLPTLLLGAALLPGVLGSFWTGLDHCLTHGMSHHHLCIVHPPHIAHSSAMRGVVVSLLVVWCGGAALHGRTLVRQWKTACALRGWASVPARLGDDVQVIVHDEPLAVVAGWFSSKIVLSTGFLEHCSATTLEVVLAHERAHIARRDTFWSTFDRGMARLFCSPVSASLLRHLTLAQEQACDQRAVHIVGSRLVVAQALVEVAALSMTTPDGTHSVVSSVLETRVRSLLHLECSGAAPHPGRRVAHAVAAVVLLGALCWVGASPCHIVLEWCAAHLLHP